MKFQADMKAFRAALAAAGKVIPTKTPIPVTLCVKIATNDNRIVLTGTNLDMTFEMEMGADVLTEGATCIDFAPLSAFCAAAKTDSVMIEADNRRATIKAGKSRIALSTRDPLDFPSYIPADGDLVTVDPATFVRAVRFCVAAASDQETQYYLNGVAMMEQGGRVQAWGTDGHALHHADLTSIAAIGGGGILPTEAALFLIGAAEKSDSLSVMVGGHGWHMRTGPIRAWGKVVDGTFPDAQRVVDSFTGWSEFLTAPQAEIAQALTIAACGADTSAAKTKSLVVSSQLGGPVTFRGARGAAGIVHAGRAETETKATADTGFAVSSVLVQSALSAMASPVVVLSHTGRDGTSSLRIVPAQANANLAMQSIIMGIRAGAEDLADV